MSCCCSSNPKSDVPPPLDQPRMMLAPYAGRPPPARYVRTTLDCPLPSTDDPRNGRSRDRHVFVLAGRALAVCSILASLVSPSRGRWQRWPAVRVRPLDQPRPRPARAVRARGGLLHDGTSASPSVAGQLLTVRLIARRRRVLDSRRPRAFAFPDGHVYSHLAGSSTCSVTTTNSPRIAHEAGHPRRDGYFPRRASAASRDTWPGRRRWRLADDVAFELLARAGYADLRRAGPRPFRKVAASLLTALLRTSPASPADRPTPRRRCSSAASQAREDARARLCLIAASCRFSSSARPVLAQTCFGLSDVVVARIRICRRRRRRRRCRRRQVSALPAEGRGCPACAFHGVPRRRTSMTSPSSSSTLPIPSGAGWR